MRFLVTLLFLCLALLCLGSDVKAHHPVLIVPTNRAFLGVGAGYNGFNAFTAPVPTGCGTMADFGLGFNNGYANQNALIVTGGQQFPAFVGSNGFRFEFGRREALRFEERRGARLHH